MLCFLQVRKNSYEVNPKLFGDVLTKYKGVQGQHTVLFKSYEKVLSNNVKVMTTQRFPLKKWDI